MILTVNSDYYYYYYSLGRIRYSELGPPGFELETIHQEPIKPLLDLTRKAGIFDGI
jgi:hypothetical protein